MKADRIMERIWAFDHTVWRSDPAEISNRLGWLHLPESMRAATGHLKALVQSVQNDGYTDVLLLGMGGSSLAPELFYKTFGSQPARSAGSQYAPEEGACLQLDVLDSTAPARVLQLASKLDLSRTLFIVATKSGGTAETLSFFKYFYNSTAAALGKNEVGAHFIAITDPGSRLADIADQYHFRDTFLNDPNVGGRYSALSCFGLIPAALVGVDLDLLLERARAVAKNARYSDAPADGDPGLFGNESALLGVILGELAKLGRDKATIVASPAIASFGDWVEQLIAESTGKDGKGILPVVGEPLGDPEVYGDDRLFIHLRLEGDETADAALAALTGAGHPLVTLPLKELYDLGGQFFLWEMAAAVAGYRLGIQPFDQPDVEAAKVLARQMVAEYVQTGKLPAGELSPPNAQQLHAFLSQSGPGDYIALQAYVPPTAETNAALLTLRRRLRDQYQLATTVGYGPRFLHSTGQLHKGDRGNGLFIQFTADAATDVPIPDEAGETASSMSFGVLEMAQALGDGQALRDKNRRVIRFHLANDAVAGLKQLAGSSR
jgi:glucose-6-phosphate isomerase